MVNPHHVGGAGTREVIAALFTAFDAIDTDRGCRYHDSVIGPIKAVAKDIVEELVGRGEYKFKSEFALHHQAIGEARGEERGEARGVCRGEAKAILEVLAVRGVQVTAAQRKAIKACTDEEALTAWLRRAAVADKADEIFG